MCSRTLANNTGGLYVYEAKTALLLSQMFTRYRLVLLLLTISSTQTPWLSSNPITQQCKIASPSFKNVANNEMRKAWLSRLDSKPKIFRCSSLRNDMLIFSLVTESFDWERHLYKKLFWLILYSIYFLIKTLQMLLCSPHSKPSAAICYRTKGLIARMYLESSRVRGDKVEFR